MRFFLKKISKSNFLKGALLVFIGNNIANFLNFLYNLLMGRLLGPDKYGSLGAVLSIMVIFGIPLSILNLFVVKTVSSYWGKRQKGKILSFFYYLSPKLFLFGIAVSGLLIFLSPLISNFLNLDSFIPIMIGALCFVLSGPGTLNSATLTGSLAFLYLTVNSITVLTLKLIISVILVILNFGLPGALLGFFLSGIIGYFLTVKQLKIIFKGVKKETNNFLSWKLLATFVPVGLTTLTLTIFLNIDIILVRHFFSSFIAGEYVALSTMSKIIYYALGPIITVMFPFISTRAGSGLSYILPLLGTLVASLGLSMVIIFAYFLFPKFIINILFGEKYYGIIPYLGQFSFFIAIYSINSILTNFLLSLSHYKPIYPLFFISLLQGIFIFLFHSSITEVVWVNISVSLFYLVVISFFVWQKEQKTLAKVFSKAVSRGIYDRETSHP